MEIILIVKTLILPYSKILLVSTKSKIVMKKMYLKLISSVHETAVVTKVNVPHEP